jgi:hypothetical protein
LTIYRNLRPVTRSAPLSLTINAGYIHALDSPHVCVPHTYRFRRSLLRTHAVRACARTHPCAHEPSARYHTYFFALLKNDS